MPTFVSCLSCHNSMPSDAKFCGRCGKAVDRGNPLFASCCGETYMVIGRAVAHCTKCGEPLALVNGDRDLASNRVRVES